ncbi:hypothetical protein Tco_0691174 [Tanacetum coccineum]
MIARLSLFDKTVQLKNKTKIRNKISRSAPHSYQSAPVFLENKEGLLTFQKVRRTLPKNRRTFLSEPNQNAKNSYFAKGLFEMKIAINMDSSMGKMCIGKDVIEIFSDRNEGLGDWDSPEYKDTVESGGKKEPEALVFHKMDNEEDSDRYIAQFKLCLEYEVRKGKKLVKKELMVLLRGEIYFVQFIINPEEDEFEPGLIFRTRFNW